MEKSKNSKDKQKNKINLKELSKFKKLIKGHERILKAIGGL
ncbi:MAG: hypothetical protein WC595_03680 [Candidatus Nanoarchaeia archaeon]